MNVVLNPLKSVGEYVFKSDISAYKHSALEVGEIDKSTNWITYEMPNGIDLYVEDGKVESIACRETCYYAGLDLIGITLRAFETLFDLPNRDAKDKDMVYMAEYNDRVHVLEYDEVGLQVWAYEDEIFNIICSYE